MKKESKFQVGQKVKFESYSESFISTISGVEINEESERDYGILEFCYIFESPNKWAHEDQLTAV